LNQDLREEDSLRELESNSVQLILTSPPYFNVRNYTKHSRSKRKMLQDAKIYEDLNTQEKTIVEYELYLREMKEIFFRLKRLLKPTGYIIIIISDITSNKIHFPLSFHFFNLLSEIYIWQETIIWDKTIEFNDKKHRVQKYLYQPFSFYYKPNWSHEFILIFSKTKELPRSDYIKDSNFNKTEFLYNYSRSIWHITPIPPDLQDIHPARFTFEIPHHLIKYYSNRGDIIFDCFAGFGTTLIEALRLERIAVGNDKEKKYCDLMEKNIQLFNKNYDYFYNQVKLYRMKMLIKALKKRDISKKSIMNFLFQRNYPLLLINKAINRFY